MADPKTRREFDRARVVHPRALTGRESTAEVLEGAFQAYVGRQVRRAWELMRRSVRERHAVFLTFSGAMTPAGIHQSCIVPLVRAGLVDCITTTGANLYHDAHRVIGHRIREINPNADDLRLRLSRIIRIYDLGLLEETLLETDKLHNAILRKPDFQKRMTTTELHWLLGREMLAVERALGVREPCLLSAAYQMGVPVFVGAVQDGSIFLEFVKLREQLGDAFRLELDLVDDVFEMSALQHFCFAGRRRKMAVWMLGGGVPKNYTLQGEPLLSQVLGIETQGFDIDVQICVDPVDNGSLSSCPAGEGHTWGKVSADSVLDGSVYVHADVTAVFPWLTHALLSDRKARKPPLRLYDAREDAVELLRRTVARKARAMVDSPGFVLPAPKRASRGGARRARPDGA